MKDIIPEIVTIVNKHFWDLTESENKHMKVNLCPFCYDGRHNVLVLNQYVGNLYQVECYYCCARGPRADSKEKAIEAWNYRSLKDE